MVKNPPANAKRSRIQARSMVQEDSLEEEMATHCSVLAMDKGAWQATVHRVAKSWT